VKKSKIINLNIVVMVWIVDVWDYLSILHYAIIKNAKKKYIKIKDGTNMKIYKLLKKINYDDYCKWEPFCFFDTKPNLKEIKELYCKSHGEWGFNDFEVQEINISDLGEFLADLKAKQKPILVEAWDENEAHKKYKKENPYLCPLCRKGKNKYKNKPYCLGCLKKEGFIK
jgi:hypothetical protein